MGERRMRTMDGGVENESDGCGVENEKDGCGSGE